MLPAGWVQGGIVERTNRIWIGESPLSRRHIHEAAFAVLI